VTQLHLGGKHSKPHHVLLAIIIHSARDHRPETASRACNRPQIAAVELKRILSAPLLCVLFNTENSISRIGAAALASAIATPGHSVKELFLERNAVGDAGCLAFASSIHRHPTALEVLSLGDNGLTDTCAKELAEKLGSASPLSLTALQLWGNQIGDAGHESLAHMIEGTGHQAPSDAGNVHRSLITLRLHDNPITAAAVPFFEKAVQINHHIQVVRLAWESLPAGSRDIMNAYLSVNADCQFGFCTDAQAVARKTEAGEKLARKQERARSKIAAEL
jgi:Ran GTPase-activating protein (RanGAP) involved in mRNA processing and transport